jgi:hypothetical protein
MSFDPAHEPPRSRHWRHERIGSSAPGAASGARRYGAVAGAGSEPDGDLITFLVSPRASAIPRAPAVRDGRLDAAGRSHAGEESASEPAPPSMGFPHFSLRLNARDPSCFSGSTRPSSGYRETDNDRLIRRECGAHSHAEISHDDRFAQCLVACGSAISGVNGAAGDRRNAARSMRALCRIATPCPSSVVRTCRPAQGHQLPDNQVLLPVAAVFLLPKSSALSPLALDIVAQTARRADPGSIVIIRANHDHEAGETSQTAAFRGDAVRDELVREGDANSAIHILISDVTGTGIAARSVVVSVIPEAFDE